MSRSIFLNRKFEFANFLFNENFVSAMGSADMFIESTSRNTRRPGFDSSSRQPQVVAHQH